MSLARQPAAKPLLMLTITAAQHWLLDRACYLRVPVRLVLPESVDLLSQWNGPFPPWNEDGRLFDDLQALADRGFIEFHQESDSGEDRVERPAFNSLQIRRDFRAGRMLLYQLTSLGGQAWEQLALPDWSLYYELQRSEVVTSIADGENRGYETLIIRALSERIVRDALRIGSFSHNLVPIAGSEVYESIGPWEATYWKTLPTGVQVTAMAYQGENALHANWMPLALQRDAWILSEWLHEWYVPADDESLRRTSDPRWCREG